MSILTGIYSGSCLNGDIHYIWLEFYDYLQTAEDEIAELLEREKKAIEQVLQKLISPNGVVWGQLRALPRVTSS